MLHREIPKSYRKNPGLLAEFTSLREKNAGWLAESPSQPVTHMKLRSFHQLYYHLALFDIWFEDDPTENLSSSRKCGLRAIDFHLSETNEINNSGLDTIAFQAALASSILGEEDQARTLFRMTERLAAGFYSPSEETPKYPWVMIDDVGLASIHRAYSLLRLEELEGFMAYVYDVDWHIDHHANPTWRPANIGDLVRTSEYNRYANGLASEPILRPLRELAGLIGNLAGYLADANPIQFRGQAQAELRRFYHHIRHLADFYTVYPIVLDLQRAFPILYAND